MHALRLASAARRGPRRRCCPWRCPWCCPPRLALPTVLPTAGSTPPGAVHGAAHAALQRCLWIHSPSLRRPASDTDFGGAHVSCRPWTPCPGPRPQASLLVAPGSSAPAPPASGRTELRAGECGPSPSRLSNSCASPSPPPCAWRAGGDGHRGKLLPGETAELSASRRPRRHQGRSQPPGPTACGRAEVSVLNAAPGRRGHRR